MLEHMRTHLNIFTCPVCKGDLEIVENEVRCSTCDHHFRVEDDIPLLFWSNDWDTSKKDVTDTVKNFYEKSPFPNYEDVENVSDLIQKAQSTFFANLLNKQVPFNNKSTRGRMWNRSNE